MYLKMQEPSSINKKCLSLNKVQIFCPSSTQGATIMWKMQKKKVLSNDNEWFKETFIFIS